MVRDALKDGSRMKESIEDNREEIVLEAIKKGYLTEASLINKIGLSRGELELILAKLILSNKIRPTGTGGKCNCNQCPFKHYCPFARGSRGFSLRKK